MSFQERKRTQLLPWDLALTWEAVISSSSSSISTYVERSWEYGKGISRASVPATTTPTGRRTLNYRKGHRSILCHKRYRNNELIHGDQLVSFPSPQGPSHRTPTNSGTAWGLWVTLTYSFQIQSSRSCYLLLDQSLHSILINYKTAFVLNPGLTLEWFAALINTLMLYPDQ